MDSRGGSKAAPRLVSRSEHSPSTFPARSCLGFILRVATGTTLVSPDVRAALTIGFCGAFTTMSTFSYESVALLTDGDYLRAALYMGATILGCVAAVMLGTALGSKLL